MSYNKDEVKEELDMEDIYNLLEYFGAEPQMFSDHIVAKTICHNEDASQASHKLYYYENNMMFHCFTHCSPASFDVFELVQKVQHVDNLNAAIYFIVNFFNLQTKLIEADDVEYSNEDWKIFKRYDKANDITLNDNKIVLPQIDINTIKFYPQPRILSWEKGHIKKEVCDFAGIKYDPIGGNILIPHFDENDRCIGIRQRTIVQENEIWGKYKPWRHGKELFNHPLAFNLYGFNWAKDRIADIETAIIVESEKAVLNYLSYFGTENSLCVATCGSSLSKYQFQMLKECGAKELVIAYDHDYTSVDSDECRKVEEKLAKLGNKYKAYMNVSVLWDTENILDYHASPLDQGKDTFLYLFKNRIML